ncbi:RNA polymerase sigma factor [Pseudohongiella spirulinae]|uniref:RNA polymerase sigma factor n=1 Tax=Pseudohongiella spirulinae TaxID=1249552 RepID=A0A0S2KG47_9GAMM|nr:RNA polymerase sigma factor [Pseudohongiella spirulinae]
MSKSPVSGHESERTRRYQAMVDELYQDVYRYAFWLTRNPTVAEDLVQETFLRAWRSFDSLQSEGAAKAWLFTILRRENARMYERYRPELVDIDDVAVAEEGNMEPEQRRRQAELHQAILKLEKEYRDPLLLQVIGGFSGKEIAGILDLNNNTVMTRLFRARSKLKDMLHDEPDKTIEQNDLPSEEVTD